MYYEEVATVTRDHMREHLDEYLKRVNARYEERVTLIMPRQFEVSSILGGRAGVAGRETLPSLSIDAPFKQFSPAGEDLYTFLYSGRVQALVGGRSEQEVHRIARRYAGAIELFIQEHKFSPMANTVDPNELPFLITSFAYGQTSFFGAANVKDEPRKIDFWIDGFAIDVSWLVSEQGEFQHDAGT